MSHFRNLVQRGEEHDRKLGYRKTKVVKTTVPWQVEDVVPPRTEANIGKR